MTLKSRSELLQEQSTSMEIMDVDQVLEIPDTPDRLVAATHDSNCNERQNNSSTNNQKTSKDYYINGRNRNQQMENGKSVIVNGNRRLFIHANSSSSFKHPRPSINTNRHEKGKSLCNSDVLQKVTHQEGGSFAGVTDQNGHGHSGITRVNPSRKGGLSLKACKLNKTSDHGKGVDFLDSVHHKAESNAPPCTSSKAPQRKMLVRNGCISPHNIAKSKNVAKRHENGNHVKELQSGSGSGSNTLPSEGQSNMVNIMDLVSEPKEDSHKCKEKGVLHLHHHSSSKEPDAERWRTTHNHRKQRDSENNVVEESKRVSSSSSSHSNRQKESTSLRNLGKRSVLSFVEGSIGETSNSNSNSRSKRNKSVNGVETSNQVVEPIACNNNEDSSVRALQVEADEMLARELQQQLYNEELTPVLEFDQLDSRVASAMPAQQQGNSARGRRAYRLQQAATSSLNVREPRSSSSSIQRRLQPRSTSSSTRMANLRASIRSRTPAVSSPRRNSIFPSNMDVDMRMQILETLEAVGDMRRRPPTDVLRIGREFNEDDYEMLLALDDNNHQHGGATPAQINNLPESTVQAENLQECSICLETPTIGETIRHLPCLHRFHKACIDQWLRRKTSCPVCKSSIT